MDSHVLTGRQAELAYLGGEISCEKLQLGMEDVKGR